MSHPSLDAVPTALQLPSAPHDLTGPVKAWSESVAMPACKSPEPERNPVFTDQRQRGLGYPLPISEGACEYSASQPWQAIHLENEFLRLMVLPEVGGRVHFALDKLSGKEFLYRADSIQTDSATGRVPGGLEINWPVDPRHRSVSRVVQQIEEHGDGARTVWCSAYDPITRLKGMHGVCLYPGRAYVELKVRLFNRTSFTHTFNWSALAAFPATEGALLHFPENLVESRDGFFGCYCASNNLGLLQVSDQHGAAGQTFSLQKAYGELRGGMYSGLPPAVSSLIPSETKSFSQFWYPYTEIGPVRKANMDAAVSLSTGERASVGVAVTRPFPGAVVVLETEGSILNRWVKDLAPGRPFLEEANLPAGMDALTIRLRVLNSAGRELIALAPADSAHAASVTVSAKNQNPEASVPRKMETLEALYLAGARVQNDRTAAHTAEEYWQEALRRDPLHAASNNAVGLSQLKRGEFGEAESRFRTAISTLNTANSTHSDGECYYNLGLALRFQERDEEAYGAFQRASWNFGWRAPALHAAAEIDCKRGNFGVVPKYLYEALRLNADNNNARSLAVVLFRRFGRAAEAEQLVRESLLLDLLDPWACHLAGRPFPGDNQTRLDLAFDYARAGLYEQAIELLTGVDTFAQDGSLPMIHYTLATFYMHSGDFQSAQREFLAAAATHPDFCFPHRLEEMMVLARAIALQPEDARAQYYLGCLLYYYGLPLQAMEIWQSSAKLDGTFPTVWRNLALGHYNVSGDHGQALDAFDQAFYADRSDARVLHERDLLWRRLGVPPTLRYQELLEQKALAVERYDTALELATLYNTNGQPEEALSLFSSGKLKGWERDPHGVEQYIRTFVKLGRSALAQGDNERARDLFLLPLSNGVVSNDGSFGAPKSCELQFWLGEALNAAGLHAAAQAYWQKSTTLCNTTGAKAAFNESTFFVALSYGRIGERQQSRKLLRELWFAGRRIAREKPAAKAIAISILKEDEGRQQRVCGLLLQSQARVGLGQYKLAARLLEQLLTLDPNNGRALDLISDLEQATKTN